MHGRWFAVPQMKYGTGMRTRLTPTRASQAKSFSVM